MTQFWGPFTQAPNLLILTTDQQRTAQHLPPGWVPKHLPNLWHLMQTGVSFPNAMTNASPCSPSRAVFWTGTYPWINGMTRNAKPSPSSTYGGAEPLRIGQGVRVSPNGPKLTLGTLGQVLGQLNSTAGINYDVQYKGKWHLTDAFLAGISPSAQSDNQGDRAHQGQDDSTMATAYGFEGWTSPDAGSAVSPGGEGYNTLGGGVGDNDERVVAGESYDQGGTVVSAINYLARRFAGPRPTHPFCLVVSLVNPHDVWVSNGQHYSDAGYGSNDTAPPWQQGDYLQIELPATFYSSAEVLAAKPDAQVHWRQGFNPANQTTVPLALDYLRFYAYLETLADAQLGRVLAALPQDQWANTLIVRLADHGEMGMSQGGMTEKEAQANNETLRVPLIFSNPGLPQGAVCHGLAGLVDLVPTLAEICGVQGLAQNFACQGSSLANAILAGKAGTTGPQLLFGNPMSNAYALVDDAQLKAKYVVTLATGGDSWQCELYRFSSDPWQSEAVNLIPVNGLTPPGSSASSGELQRLWIAMHTALTQAMTAACLPFGELPCPWPAPPDFAARAA